MHRLLHVLCTVRAQIFSHTRTDICSLMACHAVLPIDLFAHSLPDTHIVPDWDAQESTGSGSAGSGGVSAPTVKVPTHTYIHPLHIVADLRVILLTSVK